MKFIKSYTSLSFILVFGVLFVNLFWSIPLRHREFVSVEPYIIFTFVALIPTAFLLDKLRTKLIERHTNPIVISIVFVSILFIINVLNFALTFSYFFSFAN